MAASVHRRNDPQSPTSQDRQEENVLRFWKSFQHRNGFPRLGFFAQWLCHENYGDKQREQAILLDIAARNHFKNVPTGFSDGVVLQGKQLRAVRFRMDTVAKIQLQEND